MANLRKIQPEEIKLGICFSAPVFFDDGKNMFLAPGKQVRKYHLDCLKRWEIPFLMTSGHVMDEKEIKSRIEAISKGDDLEELVDIEEFN